LTRLTPGFLAALDALKVITLTRGSLEDRLTEMRDKIARLETLLLDQSGDLRQLRSDYDALQQQLRGK
jgi:predicted  nucleic acid-binding Zn-ribbon protein